MSLTSVTQNSTTSKMGVLAVAVLNLENVMGLQVQQHTDPASGQVQPHLDVDDAAAHEATHDMYRVSPEDVELTNGKIVSTDVNLTEQDNWEKTIFKGKKYKFELGAGSKRFPSAKGNHAIFVSQRESVNRKGKIVVKLTPIIVKDGAVVRGKDVEVVCADIDDMNLSVVAHSSIKYFEALSRKAARKVMKRQGGRRRRQGCNFAEVSNGDWVLVKNASGSTNAIKYNNRIGQVIGKDNGMYSIRLIDPNSGELVHVDGPDNTSDESMAKEWFPRDGIINDLWVQDLIIINHIRDNKAKLLEDYTAVVEDASELKRQQPELASVHKEQKKFHRRRQLRRNVVIGLGIFLAAALEFAGLAFD